ncbi:PREDICTED: protein tesmin/TSO1-like CXC 6 isoform X2 [Lupinus angustifolius]|uniref:protein tesmin/TSO1-like CXC 6 isoform X2 n=1 Tax=Lupinus angustifolius TaxID=3871 RepID=UPI00092F63B2|nr:PREDICTED: protein tesmin/TSO1-like CXC 6 isoform X2 [Lupinus angustifolius]
MGEGEGSDCTPKNVLSSEAVASAAVTTPLDVPAKKLARQLDFTASQSQPQLQPLMPKPVIAMPVLPPILHPSMRVGKPDSPKSRSRPNFEVKGTTPKKKKQCNCKHSKCLKLYCECFASGIYCDGCNCVNCFNNVENEAARREAVEATLERNPNAFRPKVVSSPHGIHDRREEAGEVLILAKHNKGCHCKKSGCLKKYCECFQANVLCSESCKCIDCKNFEGSEERQALFHGNQNKNMAHIKQAANAAITGAIGSSGYSSPPVSTSKRKGQGPFVGPTTKDPSIGKSGQQVNHVRGPAPCSSLSSIQGAHVGTTTLGPSKFPYRSPLAGIIQPHHLKELCSALMLGSGQAAKMLTEDQTETSLASSTQDQLPSQKDGEVGKALVDDCSSANQTDKVSPDNSCSDGNDVPKGRPMSPGTLALMCDEQDTMSVTAASPIGSMTHACTTSSQFPYGEGMTEVSAEQERTVLTKFRDFLNGVINMGEINETRCSSFAISELESQKDPINNSPRIASTEIVDQCRSGFNGVNNAVPYEAATTTSIIPETMCSSFARSELESQKDPLIMVNRPTHDGVNKAIVPPVASTSPSMMDEQRIKLKFKIKDEQR